MDAFMTLQLLERGAVEINPLMAMVIGHSALAFASTKIVMTAFGILVLVFLSKKALSEFRKSNGWKAGVDGSVAVIKWGAGEDINTVDIKDPIVGFVFNNKGLMYNLTIEGSKFSKIDR